MKKTTITENGIKIVSVVRERGPLRRSISKWIVADDSENIVTAVMSKESSFELGRSFALT